MSIVCTGCTVPGTKEIEAVQIVNAYTGATVEFAAFRDAAERVGVKIDVALAYARDGYDHHLLPQYHAVVGTKTVPDELEKTFEGTEEEAEAAGWVEKEFGWACPPCASTAHETETKDTSEGVGQLSQLVAALNLETAAETAADPEEAFQMCQQAAALREAAARE